MGKIKRKLVYYSYQIVSILTLLVFCIVLFYHLFTPREIPLPQILVYLFFLVLGIFIGFTISLYVYKEINGNFPLQEPKGKN